MGTELPLSKKGAEPPPQFSADVNCGQTAGWIKMALGVEVCLGPGQMLDGDRAPLPKRGAEPPSNFSVHLYFSQSPQTAGWMKMPLGTEVGLSLGDIVLDGDPALQKWHNPNFRPVSVVAKLLGGLRCHLVWR